VKVTADTITDEQIRELHDAGLIDWREYQRAIRKRDHSFESPASYRSMRKRARARCAEIWNARAVKP